MKTLHLNLDLSDLQWNHPMETSEFARCMAANGWDVRVNSPGPADITVLDYKLGPPTEPNTIIFDRRDTSSLGVEAGVWDSDEKVIGYLLPMLSSDISWTWQNQRTNKPVGVITTMLWHQLRWAEYPKATEKIYDVAFAGTTRYPCSACTAHRQCLLDNWSQLSDLNALLLANTDHQNRFLTWSQAYEVARLSKVIVSPWGGCELSWRDYEAALGGAMIVKPLQAKMTLTANPWAEGSVVYGSRNWIDLRESVDIALDAYNPQHLDEVRERIFSQGKDLRVLAEALSQQIDVIRQGVAS